MYLWDNWVSSAKLGSPSLIHVYYWEYKLNLNMHKSYWAQPAENLGYILAITRWGNRISSHKLTKIRTVSGDQWAIIFFEVSPDCLHIGQNNYFEKVRSISKSYLEEIESPAQYS